MMRSITLVMYFILCGCITIFSQGTPGSPGSAKVKKPLLKWKFTSQHPFIASPVADGVRVYIGGLDSTFYALNQKDGHLLWKFRTNGQIRSAAATHQNRLVFVGGDGAIYCLDKQTGKKIWAFNTLGGILGERRYDHADYYNSQPIIENEKVYVGSGDGHMYALDVLKGTMLWSYKAEDMIHTTPVISKNKVMFGASDGYLYAVDAVKGHLVWKFKSVGHRYFPRGEMQGSPVVSGNLVFIGSRDYNLYAVDIEHGFCHWNKQFLLGWATALTATDSALFVGTSDDKLFLSLDPATGAEKWRYDAKFNIFGPPAVHNAHVYFGSQMGKLFFLNKKTGSPDWIYHTAGYESNRLMYFKENDTFRDDLFSRIKDFSSYLSMLYRLGAIYSTPAVNDGEVIFSTTEGVVYCIEKPD